MRSIAVTLLLLAAACTPRVGAGVPHRAQASPPSAPDSAPTAEPPAPSPRPPKYGNTPGALLPAGVYRHTHTYAPCGYVDDGSEESPLCVAPTHAVIAGIAASVGQAEALARAADELDLEPGYPFVVHTDELGIMNTPGIVVVLGQFAQHDDAKAFEGVLGAAIATEILTLPTPDEAHAARPNQEPGVHAARVVGAAAVPVFGGVKEEDGDTMFPPTHDGVRKGVTSEQIFSEQICTLEPGAVISAPYKQSMFGVYQWFPATCKDGSSGWIRWHNTTRDRTVIRVGDHHEVIQLVGAECDSPTFATHRLDAHAPPTVALSARGGGCGG